MCGCAICYSFFLPPSLAASGYGFGYFSLGPSRFLADSSERQCEENITKDNV